MQTSIAPAYLRRRGQVYYASIPVPRNLRHLVGDVRLMQSLKTTDLAEANQLKGAVVENLKARLHALQDGAAAPSLVAVPDSLKYAAKPDASYLRPRLGVYYAYIPVPRRLRHLMADVRLTVSLRTRDAAEAEQRRPAAVAFLRERLRAMQEQAEQPTAPIIAAGDMTRATSAILTTEQQAITQAMRGLVSTLRRSMLPTLTIEHATPRKRGGTDHPANLYLMPANVNSSKGKMTAAEFHIRTGTSGRILAPWERVMVFLGDAEANAPTLALADHIRAWRTEWLPRLIAESMDCAACADVS